MSQARKKSLLWSRRANEDHRRYKGLVNDVLGTVRLTDDIMAKVRDESV